MYSLESPLGGTNSNVPWLKQPLSRTNFHGPKEVRAIEVRLYTFSEFADHILTGLHTGVLSTICFLFGETSPKSKDYFFYFKMDASLLLRFYYTIWHFMTSFANNIEEKTKAMFDQI